MCVLWIECVLAIIIIISRKTEKKKNTNKNNPLQNRRHQKVSVVCCVVRSSYIEILWTCAFHILIFSSFFIAHIIHIIQFNLMELCNAKGTHPFKHPTYVCKAGEKSEFKLRMLNKGKYRFAF